MSDATRRTFLAVAGTGATAAAAVVAAPGASAAPTSVAADRHEDAGHPLVAQVQDPASGRLTIMYGEEEVIVHDADLVRRLTRAARK